MSKKGKNRGVFSTDAMGASTRNFEKKAIIIAPAIFGTFSTVFIKEKITKLL